MFKKGDEIEVTNAKSTYYRQRGAFVRYGTHSGFYIDIPKHGIVFLPWGIEKVKENKDNATA